jgi:hypothetical protein
VPIIEWLQSRTQSSGHLASSARLDQANSQPASIANPLITQQQSLGNQAVQRMLRSRMIQAKLRISEPGDQYEREADRVADAVMRMPDPGATRSAGVARKAQGIQVQRVCPECEEEIRRQPMEEEYESEEEDIVPDETGMPKRESEAASPTTSLVVPIHAPRGGGYPLELGARHFMEQRMGHDFSHVRVHTDTASIKSARKLKAHAYTVGRDIHFNEEQYNPGSFEGRKLLAHELTHVVQQTGQVETGRSSADLQVQPQRLERRRGTTPSAQPCPQGKQRRVVRDDCSPGPPLDTGNFIRHLEVSLNDQLVTASWGSQDRRQPATRSDTWPCSPNPDVTPTGRDSVGTKCSVNHTNRHRDGMAWFTGFMSQGLRIGFHNSQPVGQGVRSHGCVRVLCSVARTINQNTWSDVTTINVS